MARLTKAGRRKPAKIGPNRKKRGTAVKREPEPPEIPQENPPKNPMANLPKRPKREIPSRTTWQTEERLTRKKRQNKSVLANEPKLITHKEKKAFYEFLQQKGFSGLNNDQLLLKTFPNRSIPEIKRLIDSYAQKGRELNRKNEETISGGNADAAKQPIEKWFDLIHSLVPNPVKKDDISSLFVDFFDEYPKQGLLEMSGEPDEEGELKPNYRVIYDTIRDILNGKYAKLIEPINAFFILKLVEELKQFINRDNNHKEMQFLKSGIWWQIPNETNAQKNNDNIVRAITALRRQQRTEQPTEDDTESQTGFPDNSILNTNVGEEFVGNDTLTNDLMEENMKSFEDIKNYPKLRKIFECLNPLRVPIQLTSDECKRWQRM